jgi:hypothetical protein
MFGAKYSSTAGRMTRRSNRPGSAIPWATGRMTRWLSM